MLYKSLTPANATPFNLRALVADAINQNQNVIVFDIDTTNGAVTINLGSITEFLYGAGAQLNGAGALINGAGKGAGALTFYVNGNRKAGANPIIINAHRVNTGSEVDLDTICGLNQVLVNAAVGTTFQLSICGRHNWQYLECHD